MKRLAILLVLAAGMVWAQESQEPAHEAAGHAAAGHEAGDPYLLYKWVNFAILVAGLGYLAVKVGGPALRSQQQAILDQLAEASRRAEAAAAEAAEIDRKVSGLEEEVGNIRAKAQAEMAAEVERVEAETAQLLAKVQHAAELEIASAAKHATQQIKATATQLALDLAARKLRDRMSAGVQGTLVSRFVKHLENQPEMRQ
jgi:F0F1-type ATP synthase membrane subunit b/b'